jgi:hypothetical protein
MPKTHRAASVLPCASILLLLAGSIAPAQVSRATLNQVSQLILQSHKLLTEENNAKDARVACEKASAIDKASGDPFISAMVHLCLGDVADHEENSEIACRHYESALTQFKAVPARHPAQRTLRTHMNVTQGKRLTLACGS